MKASDLRIGVPSVVFSRFWRTVTNIIKSSKRKCNRNSSKKGEGLSMNRKTAICLSLLLLAVFTAAALLVRRPAAAPVRTLAEASADELMTGGDEVRVALELLPGEVLNINTASAEELRKLPGIGAELSEAIVRYREEHGPFARSEDITDVPGIGQGRYAAIADSITVEETP